MPEGPEVRRHADRLDHALRGKPILEISARTRVAHAWLAKHPARLIGRPISRVRSHGKHLIGWIDGGYYFHSHFMMWGRWEVAPAAPPEKDRRERARIVTPGAAAILTSAPVFEVGKGDPYQKLRNVRLLGPDALPYPDEGDFDRTEFLHRLAARRNRRRDVGVVLLDQGVVAGLGNYLRAEILFECRLDPWKKVADLSADEMECLCDAIPRIARQAYETGGVTVTAELRNRMLGDASLTYRPASDYGSRHYVFRRTNLPCLRCEQPIRQLRQVTLQDAEGDRSRITYFCPSCQHTKAALKPRPPRARALRKKA